MYTNITMQKLLAKNKCGNYSVHEPIYAMANVFSDRNEEIGIQVNPDPLHVGLPYFKYYNASSYTNATKVARISMQHPLYIRHNNSDGKSNWILNSKERKLLYTCLNTMSNKYIGFSVWQAVIIDYNNEKFEALSIEEIKECTVRNKEAWINEYSSVSRFIDTIVPIDTTMPNYLLLR